MASARAFYTTRAAAGALGARHSLRPLIGGRKLMANLARFRRRDREAVFPRAPHRRPGERRDPTTVRRLAARCVISVFQPYLHGVMGPGLRRDYARTRLRPARVA